MNVSDCVCNWVFVCICVLLLVLLLSSYSATHSELMLFCVLVQSNKTKIAIDEKLFPDLMSYIGIQLSNSDLFFSLQSVKNEKGYIINYCCTLSPAALVLGY